MRAKKIIRFFNRYRILGLVIVALLVGLGLDLAGFDTAAHIILGGGAILAVLPIVFDMVESVRSGQYGLDILAVTAIVTSVVMKEYWAGMIIVLMLTGGEALEDYAGERAKVELTALLKRKPTKAHLVKGIQVIEASVSTIRSGDKLVIYPGEVVPVDGEIYEGTSSFDESGLTGESLPITKNVGEQLLSGSVNVEGAIRIKALNSAADSQYEQIIKLVRSASKSQSPFVRLADRYSIPFTVIAFMIAVTAWVLSGDPKRFLEVLVVATPCPLLLGAPIALISGMSRAAKYGIIVKTGGALERLAEIKTMAFDKTGTLTKGVPIVNMVITYGSHTKADVLYYAAALEQNSTHILARAIVTAADKDKNRKLQSAKQIKEESGHGLAGRINGKSLLIGRLQMLKDHEVELPAAWHDPAKQTATYLAVDGKLAGVITFADEVRPESKIMLDRLKHAGITHTLMVTGDNELTAKAVAKQLGITSVQANCLPGDKIHAIEQVPTGPVAFVGDGVNDAPVLTAADVGIALGARGSTAASESADVVIMLDDVSKVATAVEVAKRTFSIARQSILIGISISLVLMIIFATGRFRASQGAAVQELVDITVIIYALRAHSAPKRRH